jgi:long-subunit fatty acid transport protein
LTIAAETTYVSWSGYEYIHFSEEIPRDMRNCLILSLGCEYGIYKPGVDYFLRAGYRYDPQPVKAPEFTLHAITIGAGFRYGKITADFGAAFYTGPAEMFSQHHTVISGTLIINL